MHYGKKHGTDDHQGRSPALLVVYATEKRGEDDGAERKHRRDETRHAGIDAIFEDHQLGRELQEREHAGVEHQAEQGDVPEPLVGEEVLEVGELETVLRILLGPGGDGILLLVHHAVDDEADHSYAEQRGAQAD